MKQTLKEKRQVNSSLLNRICIYRILVTGRWFSWYKKESAELTLLNWEGIDEIGLNNIRIKSTKLALLFKKESMELALMTQGESMKLTLLPKKGIGGIDFANLGRNSVEDIWNFHSKQIIS